MEALVQIKVEPEDPGFEVEVNFKVESDEEPHNNDEDASYNFVGIKQELPDHIDVKIEPEDDYETPYEHNEHHEHILPDISMEIGQPTYYDHSKGNLNLILFLLNIEIL